MPTGVEQAPLSRPPRAGDVGNVVDALPEAGPDGTPYAAFVAPALLATSAMNSAENETTGGVWWRLKFERFYDSILATPLHSRNSSSWPRRPWASTTRCACRR